MDLNSIYARAWQEKLAQLRAEDRYLYDEDYAECHRHALGVVAEQVREEQAKGGTGVPSVHQPAHG